MNGVEVLFRSRGQDIGFYFGNEVLELERRIAISMEKVRKSAENFRWKRKSEGESQEFLMFRMVLVWRDRG